MAIISHHHRFIFLKTRKTAGSSIEIALASICGPEDVMCPTGDGKKFGIFERNNQKGFGELAFADYSKFSTRLVRNIIKRRRPDLRRSIKKLKRKIKSSHSDAKEIKNICGNDVWNSYYKFCFERNPFDRLVSLYHWRNRRTATKPPFKDFVHLVVEKYQKSQSRVDSSSFWTNRPFYEIDGRIVVDRVCRFEDLQREMDLFFNRIGVPWDGNLTHMKGGYRPKMHYREYYDQELIELCEDVFAYEIENLGYYF